ncbi:MAG TPA: sodium:proton antiporter NhaD, partial [Chroococcales cyanobacterium]
MHLIWATLLVFLSPSLALAAEGSALDLTQHWVGLSSLGIFLLAYLAVMGEELLHLRKSKPVLIAAALIWGLIGLAYAMAGNQHTAAEAVRRNLLDFSELFLFLLAAMTFINTMEDRGVFQALRSWLVGQGFSLRTLFWITGALAFWISPLADNLTTALIMGAVALSVGTGKPKFVALACINIVVAANAGGTFSPFGDITTLMVWQKGLVAFGDFFRLLVPSLVNWLVPALIMSLAVEKARPAPLPEKAFLQPGALPVVFLFILTVAMAVMAHNFLHLPPVLGMMGGLGLLKFYAYFHRFRHRREILNEPEDMLSESADPRPRILFDPFKQLERAEWDTLMFFYGVILSVGGLGTIGYLALASQAMYGILGATNANILVGLFSSVVDNIP